MVGGSVLCPRLTVTHKWFADCRGEYEEQQNLWVPWAPERRVYKKVSGETDRKRLHTHTHIIKEYQSTKIYYCSSYIYWNTLPYGWSIGGDFSWLWTMSMY